MVEALFLGDAHRMELTTEDLIAAVVDYRPPSEIKRHELTNEQWRLVRGQFPKPKNWRGRPRHPRRLLDAVFWLLRTGAPWRDLPERYGPWRTVWRRFHEWRQSGCLAEVKAALLCELNERGKLDWDLWCVDGTSIRASRAAVGAGKKGASRSASRRTTRSVALAAASEPRSTS